MVPLSARTKSRKKQKCSQERGPNNKNKNIFLLNLTLSSEGTRMWRIVIFCLSLSCAFHFVVAQAAINAQADKTLSLDSKQSTHANNIQVAEIIRHADRNRAHAEPFRYTLTLVEIKGEQKVARQILDVAMRFYKPDEQQDGDTRALVRFTDPPTER